jgi:hypothetical protein
LSNVYLIRDDVVVVTSDDDHAYDSGTDTTQNLLADGDVEVSFGPPRVSRRRADEEDEGDFDENLADLLTESELSIVAEKLITAIEQDDQTRHEWLENMSTGLSLLGLQVKNAKGAATSGATPQEGVSTVDNPLLLEAVLRFQANARGELLPTDGPVKVRNDGEDTLLADALAQALEKDLNHYLTKTAKEYYPDTDRLLQMLGFCGIAFKKGYHDPIKQRPVLASIDAEDLVVANTASNLEGAGRITHKIKMKPSMVRRMQLLGVYRDIHLPSMTGVPQQRDPVKQKVDQIQGVAPQVYVEPDEQDRDFYECYTEIELPNFEHTTLDDDGEEVETGLPLPYKITIDREARRILEIRRNWDEDDPLCLPRNRFIAYIFVPGLGFYGIGLLNILGNATRAVTAAWRLMLDGGMFASFPGFL